MSNLSEVLGLVPALGLLTGRVSEIDDAGRVHVRLHADGTMLGCRVLHTGPGDAAFNADDEVLVWPGTAASGGGVVLGRLGDAGPLTAPLAMVPPDRPARLCLEAQGEIVLRNGQARLRISPEGDVELLCRSFVSRSQRLLRLLAPFIKLN